MYRCFLIALANLRRLCAAGALLEVIIGLDAARDRSELERLQIQELSLSHVDSVLAERYGRAGFEITERGERLPANWPDLQTSWAKRLSRSSSRSLIYIIARAVNITESLVDQVFPATGV